MGDAGFAEARHDVWLHARKMWEASLVTGSAGNVSARIDDALIAITPTSIPYSDMVAKDIAVVELSSGRPVDAASKPSYELPMHLVIYRERSDVRAIVHTHAPFTTALSVLRKPLPPVLEEMVVALGGAVEVADYAFTGTTDVGRNALRALGDRAAVLLANHGNVCVGRDLAHALHVAIAMEAGARVYVEALRVGEPVPLPPESVAAARRLFEQRR